MVKGYWIAVALLAGGLIGFIGGRAGRHETAATAAPLKAHLVTDPVSSTPPRPDRVPGSGATTASRPGDSKAATAVTFTTTEDAPPQPARCAGCIYVQGDDPNAPPVLLRDSGAVEHEEFMREARDDSWAYLRESEIENSLLADISAGRFNKDRIECRATLCEVELSAKPEQVETLRKWYDEKVASRRFDTNEPLALGLTSFQADASKASVKITYRKPERMLPPPRKN